MWIPSITLIFKFGLIICTVHCLNDEFCTINTNSGQIRGKQNETLFEKIPYYSFRGVPFAKAPIGELRFKAPRKIEPWNETLDAFQFGEDCIQMNQEDDTIFGAENCLFLNVYVPRVCPMDMKSPKLPVAFYIFGGQFAFGSSSFYGPDFIMETDVILVTINYRVGVFGFLNLNSAEYSGNMALKDQNLALRWIHENIEHFGGDKRKITLFGHSSGSSSINIHMLSPQSNTLFENAILMSGSALNPFIPRQHSHKSLLYNLADNLHYPISEEKDLQDFLQEIDGKLLYRMTYQKDYVPGFGRKSFNRIWSICIEDEKAFEPFLTESPFSILSDENFTSHINTLYSSSPWEIILTDEQKNPDLLKNFDRRFEIDLPLEFATMDWKSQASKEILQRIREFYFDGEHVDAHNLDKMNMLMTDTKFQYANNLCARIQAAKSTGQTFYAEFHATNDWSYSQRKAEQSNYTANFPMHSDVLFYVFRFTAYPRTISDKDYQQLSKHSLPGQIIKNTTNFFMNFAKFNNPMPDREPVYFKTPKSRHFHFYNIVDDGIFVKKDPYQARMEFWNDIFNGYKHLWNTTFNFHFA